MKKYERLRMKYPEFISADSMYKICGISKRSALYLLEHGIIPVTNTGKKTWRYKIALEDVIRYLVKREKEGSMIPRGAVNSPRCYQVGPRESFSSLVKAGEEGELREYFAFIYDDFPDVLRIGDLIEMTGLSDKTISSYLNKGDLRFISNCPHYLVPKPYVLDFVCSPKYINCQSNSAAFKKILGGYRLWKTAR